MTHKFTPLDILNRGAEYGIVISLDGDDLIINVPEETDPDTRNRALGVISTHKPEILEYLRSLESQPLCYQCLNPGLETACDLVGPDDLMYCQRHYDELMKTAD